MDDAERAQRAFIGLGSNLSDPKSQVISGIKMIRDLRSVELIACSSLYVSTPIGPIKQNDFINAVVCVATTLSAHELLAMLVDIEVKHHRVRPIKWGPRTLDLDILLYAGQIMQTKSLTIPHPELHKRLFCLLPLLEIDPDVSLPDGKKLQDFLPKDIPSSSIKKLDTHCV